MPAINQSALVLFSAQQMFDIVADIEAYPRFLKWCKSTQILDKTGNEVVARVDIHYKGIQQSFTTKNTNIAPESIEMGLHDNQNAFEHMQGGWQFLSLEMDDKEACKVEFHLDFSMKNKIASTIFKTVFQQIINSQVDGFVKRAEELYA